MTWNGVSLLTCLTILTMTPASAIAETESTFEFDGFAHEYELRATADDRNAATVMAAELYQRNREGASAAAEIFEAMDRTERSEGAMEIIMHQQPDLTPVLVEGFPVTKHALQREEKLRQAGESMESRQRIRVSGKSTKIDEGLDALSGVLGATKYGPIASRFVGGLKSVYPAARRAWNALDDEPMPPGAPRTIASLSAGIQHAMVKSPQGRAFKPALEKLGLNLGLPYAQQTAVKRAAAWNQIDRIKNDTTKVKHYEEAQSKELNKIKTGVDFLVRNSQEEPVEASYDLQTEVAHHMRDGAGSMAVLSSFLLFNHHDEDARQMLYWSSMAGQLANLIEAGPQMGLHALANGWLGLAMNLLLAPQSSKNASLAPRIIQELEGIRRQVYEVGRVLLTRLNQIDERLGGMLEIVLSDLASIKADVRFTSEEIQKIDRHVINLQQELTAQVSGLTEIILEEQDMSCFQYDGNDHILPAKDVEKCRDTYVYRASKFSRNSISQPINTARFSIDELRDDVPFAQLYQKFATSSRFPGTEKNSQLADPTTWLRSTGQFLDFFLVHPDHLGDITMSSAGRSEVYSRTLDPMIQAGEEILDFQKWASIEGQKADGPAATRALTLLAILRGKFEDSVKFMDQQIRDAGFRADVRRGVAALLPADAHFHFQTLPNVEVGEKFQLTIRDFVNTLAGRQMNAMKGSEKYRVTPEAIHDIESRIATAPHSVFVTNPHLANGIDTELLRLEYMHPQEFRVIPVLQKVAFRNLDLTHEIQLDADVTYDIFLERLKDHARVRAQTLTATNNPVRIALNDVSYLFRWDQGPRAVFDGHTFMSLVATELATFRSYRFQSSHDETQTANLNALSARLKEEYGRQKVHILKLFNVEQRTQDVEIVKRQLAMLVTMHRVEHSESVVNFLRKLEGDSRGKLNVNHLAHSILAYDHDFDWYQTDYAQFFRELGDDIAKIAEESPGPKVGINAIEERIEQLRRVREARAQLLSTPNP